ncbi:MAG: hypothetical protein MI744_14060 [Pseudomonadales bacterium]|nr:hypothetical protein [Pseudomonadales bacterium]
MKVPFWIINILACLLIGGGIGFSQVSFEKPRYVGSAVLYERILFDEYWDAAPAFLVEAELVRDSSPTDSLEKEGDLETISRGLLSGWLQLLNERLFLFPFDQALKSNTIGVDLRRYARLENGNADGLNQQSISFHVVGNDEAVVRAELERWMGDVKASSTIKARAAIQSWLLRNASALRVLSRDDKSGLSESAVVKLGDIAGQFERAAERFPGIAPFQQQVPEIRLVAVNSDRTLGTAVWALMGGLVGGFVSIGLRRRGAR